MLKNCLEPPLSHDEAIKKVGETKGEVITSFVQFPDCEPLPNGA
jgi:hypothetical protein